MLSYETQLRLIPFVIIFVVMALWEWLGPRRTGQNRRGRWPGNLGVFVTDVITLSLLPITAVWAVVFSIQHKFGLFYWVEFPFWPKVIVCLLVLDLTIYWQHRLFHQIKPLWRIHRMHHTDLAFDVTTALRFHPVEIALSMLVKALTIILLGAPFFAVVAFEIILNGCAMFNHGNVKMPGWLDSILRSVIVTPDMHRVHHSVYPEEHNRNYGFSLSIWDRIFRSYHGQPANTHEKMQIGLEIFNTPGEDRLDRLLTQPFRKAG